MEASAIADAQAQNESGNASGEAGGSTANRAGTIAGGVLLSRIAGLIRDSIFAHYLGNSATADAFKAGFRIPNILQNLFGEGVLSASFIPVYGKLLGEGDTETADMVAWGVGAILTLGVSVLVALGVMVTPYLIDVIAPGFEGDKRELTIQIVRILFPGAGLLVISAWFLGVLNSHHKFFISYTAPVAWNVAMIAALLWYGPRRSQDGLAIAISWASVVGSALQIAVQAPATMALLSKHRIDFARVAAPLRAVFRNLTPVVASRGVVNLTTYVDNVLSSLLPTGAVAALNYGQLLYMMPISLFGYSVAASELPAMSRAAGAMPEQMNAILRTRLNHGLRQIAFMVIPSSAAFLILGDVIVALIYQSGAFTHSDSIYVWGVVAGSGIGLLAATMGRLYNSAFYALFDTRTPLRFAMIRVALTLVLGYLCAIPLPHLIGIAQKWGVAGLTASAGVAGWVEFALLRASLNKRIGWTGLEQSYLARLWTLSIGAAILAFGLKLRIAGLGPRIGGLAILSVYGGIYLLGAWMMKMPELRLIVAQITRRFGARANDRSLR
ncbi:MAG: murein biosynthesis integral membrane protein MurJ [Candidatus Binatus sp.]|uniref:murein biosynthesis integral membrane protein MurJ n=1 Tax=Candidatus Binatus sp. TaxID=2811406 RepID=UPI00271F7FC3|nr:murein biosynthesis integral membrane protein MurJ [Candidatus Binatus sp.]MDO8434371.1 murein biosynthesis integral membrane protein MurJ [Candidatus Binatus sp.]